MRFLLSIMLVLNVFQFINASNQNDDDIPAIFFAIICGIITIIAICNV